MRRRGNRLGEVLTGLATTAREELDLRRRVSAGRAGLRRGVAIIVLLTIGFAGFLTIFGGAYVAPYATPAGQVALTVVLGMFATGFVWMRRLSGVEDAEPFLGRPGRSMTPQDVAVVASLTGSSSTAAPRPTGGPR